MGIEVICLYKQDFSYAEGIGGSLKARQSLATLFNTYFAPATAIQTTQIVLAAGASAALDALVQAICDPGDAVLLATPYWSGLDISLSVQNETVIIPVPVPVTSTLEDDEIIRLYEKSLEGSRRRVTAVLICNPSNPVGNCYSPKLLEKLLSFCNSHGLHLISDEVYALSVYGIGAKFRSALSLKGDLKNVSVIYGLSKDFGCSGIRLVSRIFQTASPEAVLTYPGGSSHTE